MSLVPARTITAAGFRSITSAFIRPSISPVIWPLMPRLTKSRSGKYSLRRQPSVMESPRNTMRGLAGLRRRRALALASRVAAKVVAVRVREFAFLLVEQRAESATPCVVTSRNSANCLRASSGNGNGFGTASASAK